LREYELSVIYDLALAEAGGAEASVERLTRLVESYGGSIKNVDHWGRRRMAYPINKAIDGDYIVSRVDVEPSAVGSIEAALRIDESVFRSLVVRADELFEIAPFQERPPREPREPRPDGPAPTADAAVTALPTADPAESEPPPAEPQIAPVAEAPAEAPAAEPAADIEPVAEVESSADDEPAEEPPAAEEPAAAAAEPDEPEEKAEE
jgi:small subunit ribosomal protein S6